MIGPSSKGGSNLAQSFMKNAATQPTQAMPEIQQPQQQGMPQVQSPPPVMGSMAPQQPAFNPQNYRVGAIGGGGGSDDSYGNGGQMGLIPLSKREIEGRKRLQEIFGLTSASPLFMPDFQQQPQASAPQPSQAQLLARAINERAQARG